MDKQARLTEQEIQLVRSVFSGDTGGSLLKVLRKVFCPSYDLTAGLGENVDIFWTELNKLPMMAPADREIAILSRIKTIEFLEDGLERLSVVANVAQSTGAMDSAK